MHCRCVTHSRLLMDQRPLLRKLFANPHRWQGPKASDYIQERWALVRTAFEKDPGVPEAIRRRADTASQPRKRSSLAQGEVAKEQPTKLQAELEASVAQDPMAGLARQPLTHWIDKAILPKVFAQAAYSPAQAPEWVFNVTVGNQCVMFPSECLRRLLYLFHLGLKEGSRGIEPPDYVSHGAALELMQLCNVDGRFAPLLAQVRLL